MYKEIFSFEWKAFTRNRLQVSLYIILVLAGLYAIHYGNGIVKHQCNVLSELKQDEAKLYDSLKQSFAADTTTLTGKKTYASIAEPRATWARHRYNTYFSPNSFSALAIGQRDVFPYYHKLISHSLYMQVFRNEIANPKKLLTGNLDLAFVFVFLFPLFIIGMSYGLISTEKENGTYAIIRTQPVSFNKLILAKLAFRFGLVAVPVIALSLIGLYITGGGASFSFAVTWITALLFYMLFWISLCYAVASLRKPSAFNAMLLLSVWMLLIVILPSLLNSIAVYRYPINQTGLTSIIRRIQFDETKEGAYELVKKYEAGHPQFADSDTSFPALMRKVYPMAGQLGDEAARPMVKSYYQSIQNRDAFVSDFSWANPAVAAQSALNGLACSDIDSYLAYQDAIQSFHQKLVRFYQDPLFLKKQMTLDDYKTQPSFNWTAKENIKSVWKNIFILALWTAFLFVLGYGGFRRKED